MAKIRGIYQINDDGWHVSIRKNPEQEYIRLYAAAGEITDEEMALAYRIAAVDELLEAAISIRNWIEGSGCLPTELNTVKNLETAIAKAEGKS